MDGSILSPGAWYHCNDAPNSTDVLPSHCLNLDPVVSAPPNRTSLQSLQMCTHGLQHSWPKIIVRLILIVPFLLFGATSNLLSAIVFANRHMRKYLLNWLLFALSICDFVVLLFAVFLLTIPTAADLIGSVGLLEWAIVTQRYIHPLNAIARTVNTYITVLICVYRSIAINRKNARLQSLLNDAVTKSSITTVLLFAASFNVTRFVDSTIELCHLVSGNDLSKNQPKLSAMFTASPQWQNWAYVRLYKTYAFWFVEFFIPYAILLFCGGVQIRLVWLSPQTPTNKPNKPCEVQPATIDRASQKRQAPTAVLAEADSLTAASLSVGSFNGIAPESGLMRTRSVSQSHDATAKRHNNEGRGHAVGTSNRALVAPRVESSNPDNVPVCWSATNGTETVVAAVARWPLKQTPALEHSGSMISLQVPRANSGVPSGVMSEEMQRLQRMADNLDATLAAARKTCPSPTPSTPSRRARLVTAKSQPLIQIVRTNPQLLTHTTGVRKYLKQNEDNASRRSSSSRSSCASSCRSSLYNDPIIEDDDDGGDENEKDGNESNNSNDSSRRGSVCRHPCALSRKQLSMRVTPAEQLLYTHKTKLSISQCHDITPQLKLKHLRKIYDNARKLSEEEKSAMNEESPQPSTSGVNVVEGVTSSSPNHRTSVASQTSSARAIIDRRKISTESGQQPAQMIEHRKSSNVSLGSHHSLASQSIHLASEHARHSNSSAELPLGDVYPIQDPSSNDRAIGSSVIPVVAVRRATTIEQTFFDTQIANQTKEKIRNSFCVIGEQEKKAANAAPPRTVVGVSIGELGLGVGERAQYRQARSTSMRRILSVHPTRTYYGRPKASLVSVRKTKKDRTKSLKSDTGTKSEFDRVKVAEK